VGRFLALEPSVDEHVTQNTLSHSVDIAGRVPSLAIARFSLCLKHLCPLPERLRGDGRRGNAAKAPMIRRRWHCELRRGLRRMTVRRPGALQRLLAPSYLARRPSNEIHKLKYSKKPPSSLVCPAHLVDSVAYCSKVFRSSATPSPRIPTPRAVPRTGSKGRWGHAGNVFTNMAVRGSRPNPAAVCLRDQGPSSAC